MAWNPLRTIVERHWPCAALWALAAVVYGLVKLLAWLCR
jgi:hypothetical protein